MFVCKLILSVALNVGIFALLLFVPAGTLSWWRAWSFLGVVFFAAVMTMAGVFRDDEELLNERFKPPIQKGQPLADKIVLLSFIATFLAVIVFIPLDVFRFQLMGKPGPLVSSFGLVLFVGGWWLIALALRENTFAAPVVKHQQERRQTVVDTGVYGVVRHPMYAGGVLLLVGLPLWLQSYAAALLASAPIGMLAARVLIEERFLRRELPGYAAYTEKIRHRLIPFFW